MYARSVPFCTGICWTGTDTSGVGTGITSGTMPNAAYFAEDRQDAQVRAHPRERQAAEVDQVHHAAQVVAADDELRGAAHRVRHDFVMLDDPVHDDLWQAAEGGDQDHAQQRDRRAAGKQQEGLQDRVVGRA